MYPLNVVLVGVEDVLLPPLRRELASLAADVESEFASAAVALDCLRRTKKQPRLLITQVNEIGQEATIHGLSMALAGWPILAITPKDDSAEMLLRINRAGAAQMVPLPLDRDDFHRALAMIGAQFGASHVERHVIAVVGAAGGAGATTLSINLAHEISTQLERSTILAEMSLQLGTMASMLDLQPKVTLPHLLREIHRVDDFLVEKTLVPVSERLRVLAGPHELHSLAGVKAEHMARIVECLRKLAQVTVLDVPGGLDENQIEILRACDHVLLVGHQTIPSIRAVKMLCDSLPPERVMHSLWVVVNRFNPGLKGFGISEIQQMIGAPRIMTIANDYQAVSLAVNRGRPLRLVAPHTPILHDIDELLRAILELEAPAASLNGQGLFKRMFKSFARVDPPVAARS